jgi:Type IV secretion system pilin
MFFVYMSIIKKIFSGSLLAILALTAIAGLVSSPAYAASGLPTGTTLSNDEICTGAACAVTGGTSFGGGAQGVVGFLLQVARLITYLVGAIAVIFLVYGGVKYLTAQNEDGAKGARTIILNAVIGLIVAIVAFSIVTIVTNLVGGQFLSGN